MTTTIKKILIPILVLGVAIGGFLLLVKTKPEAQPVTITEKAWPVAVVRASPASLSPELTLYGRIEAQWDSRLTAAVSAEVIDVAVREGDLVNAGELLVRLDPSDTRLQLSQAEARIGTELARHQANLEALPREQSLLALARKELSRARDLVNKKLASQSTLDTARQAVDRQAIALSTRETAIQEHDARMAELTAARDQAQLDLDRTRVKAPFAGRIAKLLVSPGQRVRVGDGLMHIYDTDSLVVRAQIPNDQLGTVRDAMANGASLTASGELDGRPLNAKLARLAGEAGAGGGVPGLFRVDRPDAGVRPGRFVQLTLKLPPRDDLLALPAQALYGLNRIYVVDNAQRLRSVKVQRIGDQAADGQSQVLVKAPQLAADSRVLVTQLPNAMDGLKVTVINAGDAQ